MNNCLCECRALQPGLYAWRTMLMLGVIWASMANSEILVAQFGIRGRQDVVAMYLFNGRDEVTFRAQLEARSKLHLSRIVEVSHLEQAVASKLELAVQADLNRFFRCISHVRDKTKDLNLQNQAEMQQAWQEVMPLQQRLSEGLLEEGSLFEKVLEASLSPEQHVAYEKYLAERRAARTLAVLKASIADVENSIPMLARQRDALLSAVAGMDAPRKVPQGLEQHVGYVLLSKLTDENLKTIFDAAQQQAFKKLQQKYAAYDRGMTW